MKDTSAVNAWSSVRCLFESPILDERKWSKIPSIPADAFILDLEDAVPAGGKLEARGKVVEYLTKPEYFAGRLTVARPNPLDTPWGRDDVIALAEAKAPTVMIAKVGSTDDIDEVLEIFAEHGHRPNVVSSIESAAGVIEVDSIFRHPAVVASAFGPGDLHVDMGMSLYEPDGSMNRGFLYAQMRTVTAGVAYGVPVLGIAYSQNLKDLDDMKLRIEADRRLGFSGSCAFYPPHVDLINEVFTPSAEQIAEAEEIIALFEAAAASGAPAVQRANGEAILTHQYQLAQKTMARAGRSE